MENIYPGALELTTPPEAPWRWGHIDLDVLPDISNVMSNAMSPIIGYETEMAVYGIHCRSLLRSSVYRCFSADIQTSWCYRYSWPLQALFGDTIRKTCFRKWTMKDAA